MADFFHVSRFELFMSEFNYLNTEDTFSADGFFSSQEFMDYKNKIYPNGISSHGNNHLNKNYGSIPPDYLTVKNEFITEAGFELIRRMKFPWRKSRFEVSFGCLSLEEAQQLKADTFKGKGDIFRVSCEKHTVADMNLLRHGGSIIGLQILAEKYWSGIASANPFWEVLMEHPVRILEKILE